MGNKFNWADEIEDDLAPETAKGKRQEAAAMRDAAIRLIRRAQALEDQAENAVLVTFSEYGSEYAYNLPEGVATPEFGDELIVPTSRGLAVVMVTGYGRGSYTGPLKEVVGVLVRY